MKTYTRKAAAIAAAMVVMVVLTVGFIGSRAGQKKDASSNREAGVDSYNGLVQASTAEEENAAQNPEISQGDVQESSTSTPTEEKDTGSISSQEQSNSGNVSTANKAPEVKPAETKPAPAKSAQSKTAPVKVASRSLSLKDSASSVPLKASTRGAEVVSAAKQLLGKPYVYGTAGPSSFDCSGLTLYVYKKFGVSLPHSASSQSKLGQYVPKDKLQPGDLVFFTTNGKGSVSHTGIYIGGGQFIHAPEPGTTVSITTMASGYYAGRYITARRLIY